MLRTSEIDAVHRLWNGVAQFKAADSEAALEFMLDGMARLVGADAAMWVGAVRLLHGAAARRDLQLGWRGRAVKLLRPCREELAMAAAAMKEQETPETSLTTIAVAKAAGKFRAARIRDLVDMSAFRRTRHYQIFYKRAGIEDRLWISFPVNSDSESHVILDRRRPHRRFSRHEVELAAHALRGLHGFHRRALLGYGLLLASRPLSPMQRKVVALLLTDASKKAVAAALGQNYHTTHAHVREVFRRLGVPSRTALMSVWLNGR